VKYYDDDNNDNYDTSDGDDRNDYDENYPSTVIRLSFPLRMIVKLTTS
jgi:hypothetical protein